MARWIEKWFPLLLGIPAILLAIWDILDLTTLALLSACLSIIAFLLTLIVVSPIRDKERKKIIEEKLQELKNKTEQEPDKERNTTLTRKETAYKIAALDMEIRSAKDQHEKNTSMQELEKLKATMPENEESPAVILGMGGLYGIVNGLGIAEALSKYAESLGNSMAHHLSNNPAVLVSLFWVIVQDLSLYTMRLSAFLIIIIPFIHGFILTFSNRWYYDTINQKYHYFWAFIFFIIVFIQTVIFFLAALNIERVAHFILMLWLLMVINTTWLPVQSFIMKEQINLRNIFPKQWIILNFNTLSFLSVFALSPYDLPGGAQDIANNTLLNFLILLVLLARSIADYTVGWKALYNRLPE